jgi:serine/threonine protein kinase
MKYYPEGSLDHWIKKNQMESSLKYKFVNEIASASNTMFTHDLAHCDLKTQNMLIEIQNGKPTCYLTDFGITQVLSEKLMAFKLFDLVNVRGLSVHFALPEAFQNFRSKNYSKADFRADGVYSFSCIIYEIISQTPP